MERDRAVRRNLAAKHSRKFNKSVVHRDRKVDYKRKPKYRQEYTLDDSRY